MTASYRCWAEVDLNALRANLAQIRALVGPAQHILSVVKADAYGHGLRQIAAVLMESGTDVFGVANLAEARAIRTVGKGWPVLMLGACLPFELDPAIEHGVMLTISSLAEAKLASHAAQQRRKEAAVHIKVDTGMGRLGSSPASTFELVQAVRALPGLRVTGLYTHFSTAEDDASFTQDQRDTFAKVVQEATHAGARLEYIHASNSAGLLLEPNGGCNTVRAGLLVYGLVPPGLRLAGNQLQTRFAPALTWKCQVSFAKSIPAGTPISYGHTFTSTKPMRVATITAGYGDGYLRAASNRGQVLIRGARCPILGRITMDQMIVDISAKPTVQPGDEVVLIGPQGDDRVTVHEVAEWSNTIPWEVLTNITYRVARVYRGGHAA